MHRTRDASTLTRRSLLRTGAIATTAALVGIRPWSAAPAIAAPNHLLRSTYDGLVGQAFSVGSVELRLLSVSDVAGAARDLSLAGSEDAFVLAFAGPLEPALDASIHQLRNPGLGTCELFVAPVEEPRADRRYEAVIDRSVGAPKSATKRVASPDPAAGNAEAAPGASQPEPGATRLFRRIALRRTARGARADVLLRRSADARRVEGRLVRRGKTVAASAHSVREQHAVLRFAGAGELPAGAYTLILTVVDKAGRVATRRRRVTLR